jgi:AraC-like DNA-binding protein
MAWNEVECFKDPFAYQSAIGGANLEVIPTTGEEFRAELTQVRLDHLEMQRAHESAPLICVGTLRQDRKAISFPIHKNQSPIKHCGVDVVVGDIVVDDVSLMHRRTESSHDWGSMSLTLDDFDAACIAITGHELQRMELVSLVRPSPDLMSRLLSAHEEVGILARTNPDILMSPAVARGLDQKLIHLMIRCLAEAVSTNIAAGVRRRGGIVVRLEEFLEANPGRAVHLIEICAALDVAERTLRGACEEQLGMGPIRYLALRRMHNARRALLRSDPSETSVTRIATDQGFWELGHFSVSYRAMFGETPSASLNRSDN